MPSEQASFDPEFLPAGDVRTVAGILEALNVTRATKARQRSAVMRAWEKRPLRLLLAPHEAALREAGLL